MELKEEFGKVRESNNVLYIEPNYVGSVEGVEVAPDLSDYCVALNIETEIFSRTERADQKTNANKTFIMTWRNIGDGKETRVGFLEGTKIYANSEYTGKDDQHVNSLTTNYTDVFFTDIHEIPSSEMFGIKSVDISYEKFQIPQVTVTFTDVRGMSLFQPSAMRREQKLDGVNGFSKSDPVTSFFQAFFTMPLPKFTFYIKGFYGDPVCYEMMCQDFRTSFDASTGSFDVTVKFIGYLFSFLGDISFNALLAAPYSDYLGRKYWEDNIQNGRFKIYNPNKKTVSPMPTLMQIYSDYQNILTTLSNSNGGNTADAEESTHTEAISKIEQLKNKYNTWYGNIVQAAGDGTFVEKDENGNFKRVLIIKNTDKETLDEALPVNDVIRQAANELNSAISSYDETLDNVSTNLDAYKNISADIYSAEYNNDGSAEVTTNGDDRSMSVNTGSTTFTVNDNNPHADLLKKYLGAAKNKEEMIRYFAVEQPKVFVIDVDYSFLDEKKSQLLADAKEKNPSEEELNKQIVQQMTWEPTLENFTRVVIAHFETLMHMLYTTSNTILGEKRTLAMLGMKTGNVADANMEKDEDIVPPFPRCVKEEDETDNGYTYTKTRDVWIEAFGGGTNGFREVDLVRGILSGADEVIDIMVKSKNEPGSDDVNPSPINSLEIIPFPTTPYDFFSSSNPYFGSDTTGSMVGFAGKLITRMTTIFSGAWRDLANKRERGLTDLINEVGKMEAKNFVKANPQIPSILSNFVKSDDNPDMLVDGLLAVAKADNSNEFAKEYISAANGVMPWAPANSKETVALLGNKGTLEPFRFEDGGYIYPSQSFSYANMVTTYVPSAAQGNMPDDASLMYTSEPTGLTLDTYIKMSSNLSEPSFIIEGVGHTRVRDLAAESHNNGMSDLVYEKLFRWGQLVAEPEGGINTMAEYQKMFCLQGKDGADYANTYSFQRKLANRPKTFNESRGMMVIDHDAGSRYAEGVQAGFTDYFESLVSESPQFAGNYGVLRIYGIDGRPNIQTAWGSAKGGWNTPLGSGDAEVAQVKTTSGDSHKLDMSLDIKFYSKKSKESIDLPYLNREEDKVAAILLGIKELDFKQIVGQLRRTDGNPFIFVPRLGLLQLGIFALVYDFLKGGKSKENFKAYIPIEIYGDGFDAIVEYFDTLYDVKKKTIVFRLVKYFKEWCSKNASYMLAMFAEGDNGAPKDNSVFAKVQTDVVTKEEQEQANTQHQDSAVGGANALVHYAEDKDKERVAEKKKDIHYVYILSETSEKLNMLTQDLMMPTLVVRGFKKPSGVHLKDAACKSYLKSFMESLREEYKAAHHDTLAVQMTQDNLNESEDTKIALYNYLKAMYDKWVPSNSIEEWKIENFFTPNYENNHGHAFYFIDCYYAKAGFIPINMRMFKQKIDQMFGMNNYQASLISFLTDIYGQSRCQFLSVQNFIDMTDKDKMSRMFTPVPYLRMKEPKRFPDFVIVYTYEPDKTVVADNSEFKSTSFMLSDEQDIPKAISTRQEGKGFKVPAFGVSYGKQYQSYFKNVNVNMDNPVVTEQSLKLKYSIIDPKASEDSRTFRTYGQDLFDVYSNMSFTCSVEMMGCAWVQPLMYFVLLNIPMFRGSYLIQQVTHSIRPGNMTTKFVGIRMANVASRITKEYANGGMTDNQINAAGAKARLADINNDCPYQVFSVQQAHGRDLSAVLDQKVANLDAYKNGSVEVPSDMTWEECAARMCIQEAGPNRDDIYYAMQAMVMYTRYTKSKAKDKNIFSSNAYANETWNAVRAGGAKPDLDRVKGILRQIWGDPSSIEAYYSQKRDAFVDYNNPSSIYTVSSEQWPTIYFAHTRENPDKKNGEKFLFKDNINKKKSTIYSISNPTKDYTWPEPEKNKTDDNLAEGFFNAIQSTANVSPNIKCTLDKSIDSGNKYHLIITEKGKKSSGNDGRLGKVFDAILNADQSNAYMDYVSSLTWDTGDFGHNNPSKIDIVLCEKGDKKAVQKKINLALNGTTQQAFPSNLNDNLKLALAKKFGKEPTKNKQFTTDVTYSTDCKDEYFNTEIINCSTLLAPTGGGTWSDPKYVNALKDKGFDLEKAVNALIYYAGHPEQYDKNYQPHNPFNHGGTASGGQVGSQRKCGQHVCAAVNGGFKANNNDLRKEKYGNGGEFWSELMKKRPGWKEVCSGKTNNDGIATAPGYTERDGDITSFVIPGEAGHVQIRLQGTWVSDYSNKINRRNRKDVGKEFHIIRYVGK